MSSKSQWQHFYNKKILLLIIREEMVVNIMVPQNGRSQMKEIISYRKIIILNNICVRRKIALIN